MRVSRYLSKRPQLRLVATKDYEVTEGIGALDKPGRYKSVEETVSGSDGPTSRVLRCSPSRDQVLTHFDHSVGLKLGRLIVFESANSLFI
jgi:hypothetical protein